MVNALAAVTLLAVVRSLSNPTGADGYLVPGILALPLAAALAAPVALPAGWLIGGAIALLCRTASPTASGSLAGQAAESGASPPRTRSGGTVSASAGRLGGIKGSESLDPRFGRALLYASIAAAGMLPALLGTETVLRRLARTSGVWYLPEWLPDVAVVCCLLGGLAGAWLDAKRLRLARRLLMSGIGGTATGLLAGVMLPSAFAVVTWTLTGALLGLLIALLCRPVRAADVAGTTAETPP